LLAMVPELLMPSAIPGVLPFLVITTVIFSMILSGAFLGGLAMSITGKVIMKK